MLLKFHVTVVESLIVTTSACVTRVAYSNSVQPKNQLRAKGGAEPATTTYNNETTGEGPVGWLWVFGFEV